VSIDAVVRFQFRHRRWILLLLGLLVAVALLGLGSLRVDFSPQKIFVSGGEQYGFLETVHEVFGRDDSTMVVHVRADDLFAAVAVDYLERLHLRLAAVEGVVAVSDLSTVRLARPGLLLPVPVLPAADSDRDEARRFAQAHPLLVGRLLSEDGRGTLMAVEVDAERIGYTQLRPVVEAVRSAVQGEPRPVGVESSVIGIPVARVVLVGRLIADQMTFMPICIAFFFLVLWFFFREVRAVVVPMAAVLIGLVLVGGAMGFAGQRIDIINNVLPTLLFVIGVSDAIHLVARYRQELAAGVEQWPALRSTCVHLGVACLLTSVTTAIGFASLGLGRLEILRRFGLWAAGGVMATWVVTVVLVPLVLSYMPPILRAGSLTVNRFAERLAVGLAELTLARRREILVASGVVVAAAAYYAGEVRVENSLYESFPPGDAVVSANRRLEKDFAGIIPLSVVVQWEEAQAPPAGDTLRYLEELAAFVGSQPGVGAVLSPADLVAEANVVSHGGDPAWRRVPSNDEQAELLWSLLRAADGEQSGGDVLASLYREDRRMLRIVAQVGDVGSSALRALSAAIEGRLAADAGRHRQLGVHCRLSGDGPVGSAAVDRLIGDMFRSVLVAFAVIFLILVVVLRSLSAALVSMVPNVFPLLITLGVMGVLGMHLQVPTIIVFSVALGLAVDDTIHFMVRYREELTAGGEADWEGALRRTFIGTGQAIVATSVVLAVGYAVLLTSRFPITGRFGFGMLVTVAAALVGDLLVLPACLATVRPFRRRVSR
jgi:predicted RND superfamily exporter protein